MLNTAGIYRKLSPEYPYWVWVCENDGEISRRLHVDLSCEKNPIQSGVAASGKQAIFQSGDGQIHVLPIKNLWSFRHVTSYEGSSHSY